VTGTQGMALLFRFIQPIDEAKLLAESASIASSWRVRGR
jgi:hypothetical protein